MARAVKRDHLIDGDAIANLGWRQGSILGPELAKLAREHAPRTALADQADLLVVSSHDCDVVNFSLATEPVVEVLGARRVAAEKLDGRQQSGRNPRTLQILIDSNTGPSVLSFAAQNRWPVPRGLFLQEPPEADLPPKERRLVAQWLAKRYIRAAFPTPRNDQALSHRSQSTGPQALAQPCRQARAYSAAGSRSMISPLLPRSTIG